MCEIGEDSVKMKNSRLTHECQLAKKPHEKYILEFEEFLSGWISRVIHESSQVASDL